MATENMNPLDELKRLDQQVESVTDLAGLKPIFFRLDEIAKQNVNDFEVQLAVGDIKQHLVNRGGRLKALKDAPPAPAPPVIPPVPQPPPPGSVRPAPPAPQATPAWPAPAPPSPPPAPAPPSPPPAPAPPLPPPGLGPLSAPPPTGSASVPPPQLPGPPTLPQAPPRPPAAPSPMTSQAMPVQGTFSTTENTPPAPPPRTQQTAVPPAAGGSQRIPVKPPSQPPLNWKRSLWVGAFFGAVIALVGITMLVNLARKRNRQGGEAGQVQVDIVTTPPGASVRINGDAGCIAPCKFPLAAGNYQITAFLDGYEPAASGVMVTAGQPAAVNLALEPQAQSLRILTDLDSGKVALDGQPAADLQEGQFILDGVAPGSHVVKITGKSSEASLSFTITPAQIPTITGPVTVKNLNATVIASLGNHAHIVTNSGPLKLAVNGQPEADATPDGVDLKNFQAGVDELVVGDGKDQRSVKESYGPAPMLTAVFKSDLNIGTLIVSTGEDSVHVFVNNREWPRLTQRGQVRIQAIGKQTVRVAKDGFDGGPPQVAEIKKGIETRLEFKMRALPQFSSLQVTGGLPGAEVLIDQRSAGTVGTDGSFSAGSIAPGDHVVELRHDQYTPKRFPKTFRAGQTVTISGADAVLAAERVAPPPPPPPEKKVAEVPPPREKATPPPVKTGTMADWEDNGLWRQENGTYVHRGAGLLFYKMPPKGTFTFTVELLKGGNFLRGGKIRWVLNYIDAKNYSLFELDSKNFAPKVIVNGKTTERDKTPLKDLEKQKSFTIQIDVTPEHIVHKMFVSGQWVNLDVWAEPGHNFSEGKFGFQVQGNDEIGLTDFRFQPK